MRPGREDELLLGRTSTHSMCSHEEDIGADEPVEVVEEVNVLEPHTDASTQRQGYLWKRSTNVRKDWKRRWFILREGAAARQLPAALHGACANLACLTAVITRRANVHEGARRHCAADLRVQHPALHRARVQEGQ
jgi:hypothetical protein